MDRRIACVACLLPLVLAAGCAAALRPAAEATVTGTIRTGTGAYPMGSRLVIELRDVTRGGSIVAETSSGIVPGWEVAGRHDAIDFRVTYAPAGIDPSHTYVVSAMVTENGRVLAVTRDLPVITAGSPTKDIALAAGGPAEENTTAAVPAGWPSNLPPSTTTSAP